MIRVLALIHAVGACSVLGLAQERPPNVILILADDLGYADVGVQGCTDIPTPSIDSIVQR